ncbi:hypothetical protein BDV28DRAFT_132170 [Aspergillus coremiiformis]|uniref:Uncharacterized protein n=1 Tax=Aspergillus coremiiformis TaxID=138285 RepID=A0A5N6ZAL3_9EURO|nr:hypothetical protein BDV28DRAFT_132170 [Aspergillus coremiiformis]
MELSHSGAGFRSRRSYPSLNHASLAPLTSRFPIDDDVEPQDYFTPRPENAESHYSVHGAPAKTSYLSTTSYSVPGTPGLLSHSRSGSRARHHQRSRSSTRAHLSDTNLQGQEDTQPFHHQGTRSKRHPSRYHPSNSASRRDAEWMLRAGIALASSTREEKGQSWLAKRESSTSLVDEGNYDVDSPGHFNKMNRRSRSGRSTPAASRSRVVSRRTSKPDLAMTGLEVTARLGGSSDVESPTGDVRLLVPDFVDERIRAEMEVIQQEDYSSESDEYSDSEDEIDEQEMQRLTRERGFGLGSWFDRMVEWTVFGVDDWPLSYSNEPVDQVPKNVELADPSPVDEDDHVSISGRTDRTDGASTMSDSEAPAMTGKPGEHGGWEDAWWLFGVMKRAIL